MDRATPGPTWKDERKDLRGPVGWERSSEMARKPRQHPSASGILGNSERAHKSRVTWPISAGFSAGSPIRTTASECWESCYGFAIRSQGPSGTAAVTTSSTLQPLPSPT